ncbi:efflux RND transporter periplasmic adaptor subunit [Sphingomonas ginsenosidivorax]|uniref:Efflux RND transporter periplasmic adaptor subunit n=1 Tax=Sphingomonas ginsenosidivorax TaxID=862135 RepID=A0A5C6U4Y5_9SPHN|nr:efflux RND transporter periplasmic adaptor subunit [Sphingomonas ginsenosidivorax]TXC67993.1 efflux RND transporter periplasmic adaptor subunit [Sphingomonas ginsenosidivorax]
MPNSCHYRVIAAPILLGGAVAGCGHAAPDPRTQPPLVRVTTASPASDATREFTGIVAARVQSDLGFRIGGKVVARLVDAGQVVRRGQPLMRIDAADLALATRASLGTVDAARARAGQTAADERRFRDLVGAGAVSASAYDQAKAAADAARAQLSAAQAQARQTRNEIGYATLLADADGTVVETLAEPGQVVAAGQLVVRVARSGPREALVQLPETLRPRLGSVARTRTIDGSGGSATLRQLADSADPASRTFEARYVLGGAAAHAPLGSTVTVALALPGKAAGMEVPLGALRDTGRGPGVWIVRAGATPTVAWHPVRVAAIGEETAMVAAGLAAGQRFVAMGAHMLHQGQRVRIAASAPGAAR